MTVDEAIEFYQSRIKYKPNFTFEAEKSPGGSVIFHMRIGVEDSVRGERIILDYQASLAEDWLRLANQTRLVDKVFSWIKDFECHEAAEWFRIDGIRVKYPH